MLQNDDWECFPLSNIQLFFVGAKDEKASDMPVGDSLRDSLSRNTSTGGEQLPIPSARSSEKR